MQIFKILIITIYIYTDTNTVYFADYQWFVRSANQNVSCLSSR